MCVVEMCSVNQMVRSDVKIATVTLHYVITVLLQVVKLLDTGLLDVISTRLETLV